MHLINFARICNSWFVLSYENTSTSNTFFRLNYEWIFSLRLQFLFLYLLELHIIDFIIVLLKYSIHDNWVNVLRHTLVYQKLVRLKDIQSNFFLPVGESRATLVEQNERLTQALRILTESYQLALATLVILHNKYMRSKEVKNIFIRYSQMREMIKVTLRYLKWKFNNWDWIFKSYQC